MRVNQPLLFLERVAVLLRADGGGELVSARGVVRAEAELPLVRRLRLGVVHLLCVRVANVLERLSLMPEVALARVHRNLRNMELLLLPPRREGVL